MCDLSLSYLLGERGLGPPPSTDPLLSRASVHPQTV